MFGLKLVFPNICAHDARSAWYDRGRGGGILFSLCHLAGLLSGLANPLLYGYFNKVTQPGIQSIFKGSEFINFPKGNRQLKQTYKILLHLQNAMHEVLLRYFLLEYTWLLPRDLLTFCLNSSF